MSRRQSPLADWIHTLPPLTIHFRLKLTAKRWKWDSMRRFPTRPSTAFYVRPHFSYFEGFRTFFVRSQNMSFTAMELKSSLLFGGTNYLRSQNAIFGSFTLGQDAKDISAHRVWHGRWETTRLPHRLGRSRVTADSQIPRCQPLVNALFFAEETSCAKVFL